MGHKIDITLPERLAGNFAQSAQHCFKWVNDVYTPASSDNGTVTMTVTCRGMFGATHHEQILAKHAARLERCARD